ncbi:galactose oxidase [Cladorrhinum samala]|uniref:Galactose oxidase n=1 Tax=Cladorrhinum samala TaxID=585594 RepID=A0AAV9HGW8_9PEZI|nr:galactose oxidase [Cladorrhinum samala]
MRTLLLYSLSLLRLPLPVRSTWTHLSPLPHTLQEHTTLPLPHPHDASLITIGGLVANGSTTASTLVYSIPSNTWSSFTPIPTPLNHANAAVSNHTIYLMGGLSGLSQWPPSPSTFKFDLLAPEAGWQALSPIPPAHSPRGAAAVAVYNDTIYLAGGILGLWGPTVATVSAYHIPTDSWVDLPECLASLPGGEGRDHAGSAQVDSKWYILGGRRDGAENRKSEVFILDFEDLEGGWKVGEGRMPTPRGGIAAGVVGRVVYTFGGEGNNVTGSEGSDVGVFGEVEGYHVDLDEWRVGLGRMEVARHGTSAVGIGGKVYIPGGSVRQGPGGVDVFDAFEPPLGC